jgi:hypothetical protein
MRDSSWRDSLTFASERRVNIMRTTIKSAVCFAISVAPAIPQAAELVITAGRVDNFALPADAATPSAALMTLGLNFQNFDLLAGVNGSPDRQVAHTFAALPPGIDTAFLQLRVRAGNDGGVTTDGILISFVDATTTVYCDAIEWGRPFAPLASPGCFPEADPVGLVGHWNPGDSLTVTFDLSALPLASGGTMSLIPQLNSRGYIDVNVSDETGCDFMRLSIDTTTVTAVRSSTPRASARLHEALPNPFNHSTTFRFDLTGSQPVDFSIYDVSGGRVRNLVDDVMSSGPHSVLWDGKDDRGVHVASGVYLGSLRVRSQLLTTKVVLIR